MSKRNLTRDEPLRSVILKVMRCGKSLRHRRRWWSAASFTHVVVLLILMGLGTKLHGNYEYYGKYPALIWGPDAIGFLAPGVVVWYLHKRGFKSAWKIVATLALMVVSGTVTYVVQSYIFWQLGSQLHGEANYYATYPAAIWGLWGLCILGFLAPGVVVWYLHKWQFSLRTLLIAMTLIAVVLGIVISFFLLALVTGPFLTQPVVHQPPLGHRTSVPSF